jgi:hypothetical protein
MRDKLDTADPRARKDYLCTGTSPERLVRNEAEKRFEMTMGDGPAAFEVWMRYG